VNLSQTLKDAGPDEMIALATRMMNSGDKKTEAVGKYLLNTYQNKSGNRNAALFMINSDPTLRETVREMIGLSEEKEDEQQ
jgi:hypothetical protein